MIFDKLKTIICTEFEIEEDDVNLSTTFEDLGVDSLDLVDLVMTVEDEFSLELPDEELEKMKTVADLVKYIEEN